MKGVQELASGAGSGRSEHLGARYGFGGFDAKGQFVRLVGGDDGMLPVVLELEHRLAEAGVPAGGCGPRVAAAEVIATSQVVNVGEVAQRLGR